MLVDRMNGWLQVVRYRCINYGITILLALSYFIFPSSTAVRTDWLIFLFSPLIFYSLHWIFDMAIRLMFGRYFIVTKWGSSNGYRYNVVDVIFSGLGIFASTMVPIFWLEPLLRDQ
ncbi:hypothetical protein [Paraflavitalea pollutisoli]|uniref:hypothetical protein n=1 Tax=Paraflavitalea pollutisoli TaxID=3034143 RepID=UPI0023EAEBCA|nr:hypothetical protein [Paraflavitalea sp. H1-2-19X]